MDLNKIIFFTRNILYIFIFYATILSAQVSDLELNIEIENIENGVEHRQSGSFVVTITNFGPDDAGTTSNSTLPVNIISSEIGHTVDNFLDIGFLQDFNINENCYLVRVEISPPPIPGGVPRTAYIIKFPVIPVNSSMTCHGSYHIGFSEGSRTVTWRASSGAYQQEIDPNPDNNEVSLVFRIKPQIIPTLNMGFILLLIALTLVPVYFKIRKKSL